MKLATLESYAKIIGVTVACFGVYKYYDSLNQQKVNRSLSYYDEFHSGKIFDARVKIGEISYSWLSARNTDGSDLSSEDFQALVISDLSVLPGVIQFDLINEFFQRARKCVNVGGCDKETLVDLLDEEAHTFYVYFFPKIAERQVVEDYSSDGLLCFATKFKGDGC